MAIEVFNRYEKKYLLSAGAFSQMITRITDHVETDEYNRERETYAITNLYYDTPDSQLIRASLAKPMYKEKLRLRAYGVPNDGAEMYVEIKKKVRGLVNKRRSAIRLAEAHAFLQTGRLPEPAPHTNAQVLREIAYMLERLPLRPAMYVAYDRRAYFGIGEHDLRISFDRNIRFRTGELCLEAGNHGEPLLNADMWLMEIKSAQSIPIWLTRLLAEYRLYPSSFSKYGAAYMRALSRTATESALRYAIRPVAKGAVASAIVK